MANLLHFRKHFGMKISGVRLVHLAFFSIKEDMSALSQKRKAPSQPRDLSLHRQERFDHHRVEAAAGLAADFGDGGLVGQGGAVGAVAAHRVVGVGHRDDAGA